MIQKVSFEGPTFITRRPVIWQSPMHMSECHGCLNLHISMISSPPSVEQEAKMRSSALNLIFFILLSSISFYTHALPNPPSLISHLNARTQDDTSFLGPNWDVTITPQAICLPIATAAARLLEFYDSVSVPPHLPISASSAPNPPFLLSHPYQTIN